MAETATESLQQIVVFRLGNQEFGLEIGQVKEIIRLTEVTPMPNVPEAIAGMINVRGKIIPVVDICRYLGLTPTALEPTARIIVVNVGGVLVGLQVEAATDVIRVAGDTLEPASEILAGASLTSIKGVFNLNERLITLVNLTDILNISANLDLPE